MPEIEHRIRLYTYGQPRFVLLTVCIIYIDLISETLWTQNRTGNRAWAEWMSDRPFSNATYRVTRFNDAVPRLPLRAMGFWHFNSEYHIDPFRHIWYCPVKGHRLESDYCANVGWVPMPGAAHRDYFSPGSFE
jgi:hypothetical protein